MRQPQSTLFLAISLLSCIFSSGHAGSLPDSAKFVSPQTTVLINVNDFTRLQQELEKTEFYKLYKDPAMAAFANNFKSKWRQMLRRHNNELADSILDVNVLPTGRVIFALVTGDKADRKNSSQILFIAQWGPNNEKIKQSLDKNIEKAIENGASKSTEIFRGQNIVTITKPQSLLPVSGDKTAVKTKMVEPPPIRFSYCFMGESESQQCGQYLLASSDIDILKFAVSHTNGVSNASLAEDFDYINTMRILGPHSDAYIYVNFKQIMKNALAQDATGETLKMLSTLGFDNVTAFGGSLAVNRLGDTPVSVKGLLKITGSKKSLLKMFDLKSAVLNPPPFIDSKVCSITFLNWDIKAAYDELFKTLASFEPSMTGAIKVQLIPPDANGNGGVELKKDILNHLGSDVVIAANFNDSFETAGARTARILCIATNNRPALEQSLSVLQSQKPVPDGPLVPKGLFGHKIYTLAMPTEFPIVGMILSRLWPADSSTRIPAFALTVTDTHLIIGSASSVEKAIRTLTDKDAETIVQAGWFRTAKSAAPPVTGFAEFSTTAEYENIHRLLKFLKPGLGSPPNLPLSKFAPRGVLSDKWGELLDYSLLPPLDNVRRYLGPSVLYGLSRLDSLYFEFKYLSSAGPAPNAKSD